MRYILPFSLMVAALAAPVQAQDATVHELPLNIGDSGVLRQKFELFRESETGKALKSGRQHYEQDLAYSRTEAGYRVTKTRLDLQYLPADDRPSPLAAATRLYTLTSGVSYVADEALRAQAIESWDRVQAAIPDRLEAALAGEDADTVERALGVARSMLQLMTTDTAPGRMLPYDDMISHVQSLTLSLNQPVSQSDEVDFGFGGHTLKIRRTYTLTTWDEATNTAHVAYEWLSDPASLQKIGAGKAGGGISSGIDAQRRHCDYDLAIDTGLVRSGTCIDTTTAHIDAKSVTTIERTVFSQVLAE